MAYPVYYVISGDTLPHLLDSFDGGTGASITLTGLAVGDIKIYKDGGVTQRSSTSGFTLLDTDGIDFDSITGIHGFSLDLSDNTDAGFYTVGPWYHVVIDNVTIDSQTVSFVACAFRILDATRGMSGTALPDAAAEAAGGLYTRGTGAGQINQDANGRVDTNIVAISEDATAATNAEAFFDGTGYAGTNNVIPTVTTLTGHTAQTGDSFSRLGAPAGASVSADIAAVQTEVDKIGTIPALDGAGQTIGAAIAKLADDNGGADFDATTDSLVAIRDHIGDGTNLTEAGGDGDHLTEAGGDGDHLTEAGGDGDHLVEAGGTGDQFTAIPWNASWDAEVQSECADAITAASLPTAAQIKTAIEAQDGDLDRLVTALVNKRVWTEADGELEMFSDAGASHGSIAAQIATDGTYTTAKRAYREDCA